MKFLIFYFFIFWPDSVFYLLGIMFFSYVWKSWYVYIDFFRLCLVSESEEKIENKKKLFFLVLLGRKFEGNESWGKEKIRLIIFSSFLFLII